MHYKDFIKIFNNPNKNYLFSSSKSNNNAFKILNTSTHQYSYWDYQRGAWQKDNGLLIDHILLSPEASDLLINSGIDREPRGKEKASDHTPIWCELDIKE